MISKIRIIIIGSFYKTAFEEIPTEVFLSNALERAGCDIKRLDISGFPGNVTSQKIKKTDIVFYSTKIISADTKTFSTFSEYVIKPSILYTNDWIFLNKTREQNYREKIKYIDI